MNRLKNLLVKLVATLVRPVRPLARVLILLVLIGSLYLDKTGLLDPAKEILAAPSVTLQIQGFAISPYSVLQTLIVFLALFWIASLFSDWFSASLKYFPKLGTSNRSLIGQIARIGIYVLLFLVGLNMLGIDLTLLTVIGGAVGIGVGFGLQKIASNFISGLILLSEKSVEMDDLVELDDGTAGFVRRIGARCTVLETFDGKEIMIPNEDFITSRVINWTYSNLKGRIQISVGVAYGSDYELVRQLILDAAREHPDCIRDPEPQAHMRSFGDSSVDFILYFWVGDIRTGRLKPQSDVMMAITRKFDENGIVIPFPQRDVHVIKSGDGVTG
ncbi:MAG: mechanosensitive ion channel [Alphaproteobacteria bacterium]|nr:MAG: mechanosensitive ion channel [Alphaproteobacteria bacterium]